MLIEKDYCEDNHRFHYYDASIDAYVCPTCDAISPLEIPEDVIEVSEDEYETHLGI